MTRWKWQNRQKLDETERRPISGRRYPARSGRSVCDAPGAVPLTPRQCEILEAAY